MKEFLVSLANLMYEHDVTFMTSNGISMVDFDGEYYLEEDDIDSKTILKFYDSLPEEEIEED